LVQIHCPPLLYYLYVRLIAMLIPLLIITGIVFIVLNFG
jgi:hypothetical protein